jgi:hypothetical protein
MTLSPCLGGVVRACMSPSHYSTCGNHLPRLANCPGYFIAGQGTRKSAERIGRREQGDEGGQGEQRC